MTERVIPVYRRVLLSVISVCAFIGVAEVAVRLFLSIPHDIDYGICPGVCGDHRPCQATLAIHTSYDFDAPFKVKINSQGLRGKEVSLKRQSGVRRILCVGDSFTYGLYLSEGETFPDRLQEYLDTHDICGRYEVINAGHLDYTVTEELEYLQERGLMLRPDWVILQFTPFNDIEDLMRSESTRHYYKKMTPVNKWVIKTQRLLRNWKSYQAMVYVLACLRAHYLYHQMHADVEGGCFEKVMYFDGVDRTWKINEGLLQGKTGSPSSPDMSKKLDLLWSRYAEGLATMKRLLDKNGVKLMVVSYPVPDEINGGQDVPSPASCSSGAMQRMNDLLNELVISNSVDLTSNFRSEHERRGITIYKKQHPTAEANVIAAREVGALILRRDSSGHQVCGYGSGSESARQLPCAEKTAVMAVQAPAGSSLRKRSPVAPDNLKAKNHPLAEAFFDRAVY